MKLMIDNESKQLTKRDVALPRKVYRIAGMGRESGKHAYSQRFSERQVAKRCHRRLIHAFMRRDLPRLSQRFAVAVL